MRRILVIGCPGAGKSTFARALGAASGLPVVHLDRMYWTPGWKPKDREAFDADLDAALAGDAWILDGNFARTLPVRLRRADTVVWLRPSRRSCLFGALARRWRYRGGRTRDDMGPGCPEAVDWAFLWFIWRFERVTRPRLEAALAEAPSVRRLEFRSRAEAGRFISSFTTPATAEGNPYA